MSNSYNQQLELLTKILENQQRDKYGTHDEFQQLEILVYSLINNNEVPHPLKNALSTIEHYARNHNYEAELPIVSLDEINHMVEKVSEMSSHTH